jgi:hypothetical protein
LHELARQVIGHSEFSVDHHWSGIMGLRKGSHDSISEFNKTVASDAVTEEINSCGGWGVTLTPVVMRHKANEFTSSS